MKNESRRIKAGSGLIGLTLALLWLAGCVSPDILQKDYGNSVQNNIAQSGAQSPGRPDGHPDGGAGPQGRN